MKRLIGFLLLAILACSVELGQSHRLPGRRAQMTPEEKLSDARFEFGIFKIKYNRSYSSPLEELKRFEIFTEALDKTTHLNLLEKGTAVYGVNDMADWTEEEFLQRANLKPEELASMETLPTLDFAVPENVKIPSEFDWRTRNAVTPVKNQGQCGSCWAFSTVSNIENCYAIKNGEQKTFSEQQLVDCDRRSSGCNGGWMGSAIESIKEKGGLNNEADYPYTGRKGACRFKSSAVGVQVSKNQKLRSSDEKGMADYIATTSSTINGINARMLQYYKGGIIAANSRRCSNRRNALNHAINMIGYGRDSAKGMDYWIGKNSWGTNWGEDGFFRIQRGANACGIANEVMSAVVS